MYDLVLITVMVHTVTGEHSGRDPNLPNKPDDPFTPTPDRPWGGIFKIPTPAPAAQEKPQSETNGAWQQGGILQGDPVVRGGTSAQDSHNQKLVGRGRGVS